VSDQEADVWILDLNRENLMRLTFDPLPDTDPVWTPDGQRIVFSSARDGVRNLYWKAADGTGAVERLTDSPNGQTPIAFSPDGRHLVFYDEAGSTGRDIHVLIMDDERSAMPLIVAQSNQDVSDVSPDGRWIAYESIESGEDTIFVRPFPDVESGRWQVSSGNSNTPIWSPVGDELFFLALQGLRIMSVQIETNPSFSASPAQMILEGNFLIRSGSNKHTYDVSADGERFLLIKPGGSEAGAPAQPQIIVVQNWFEEINRLAPSSEQSQ
jgi:serine/threonine-protein kinase